MCILKINEYETIFYAGRYYASIAAIDVSKSTKARAQYKGIHLKHINNILIFPSIPIRITLVRSELTLTRLFSFVSIRKFGTNPTQCQHII